MTGKLRDRSNTAAWPPLAVTLEVRRDKGALVVVGGAETSERTLVLTLSGRHDLESGRRSVTIHLAPVTFKPNGRQPIDLFPIAGDAFSRVDGAVTASGTLSWAASHDLATTFDLVLDGVSFEGGITQVDDLYSHVLLDDVLPPHTPGPQHGTAKLQIASLPPGPRPAVQSTRG